MKKATRSETKPTPPFVWPSAARQAHKQCAYIFQHALKDATRILGMASAVDCRGVDWLDQFLHQSSDPQVLVVLAVFGGCPTGSDDLSRLLELQDRTEHDRIQFRVLPMAGGPGAPANCLVAVPAEGIPPVFLFGPTPNFGIDRADRTQVNMCFEAEPTLFDQWRQWFDLIWLQAAHLTEATANIPDLVPATGTPAAAAQWQTYCDLCSQFVVRSDGGRLATDSEAGEVLSGQKGYGSEDPPPTTIANLPKLDPLEDRVTRLFRAGQQVTIAYYSAIRPLEVPVNPRLLSQEAQIRMGRSSNVSHFPFRPFPTTNSRRLTPIDKRAEPFSKSWACHWRREFTGYPSKRPKYSNASGKQQTRRRRRCSISLSVETSIAL